MSLTEQVETSLRDAQSNLRNYYDELFPFGQSHNI